ncbi:bifunctional diguanylate cyclase/phosphodiesterase [Microvirga sp. 17 mud 1-3]|uniref:putative bifunctional diguanylate cyclase/phosphodiesterase n=1 Tax=Microvirga sp. 17 mud 1-3 TaxID=2082949 RepID=UPI000D6C2BD9|nr:bifunctional diguanylate cyclase/phosphodiesterase [Microvirga sp. 17 mud 1-3]AWM88089.1 hypothetical protein C4E04_15940 [Microvirga sp. 17 mud 1-3]
MTRMLLSRDAILSVYNSSGQDTLDLLGSPEPAAAPRQTRSRSGRSSSAQETSSHEASHQEGPSQDGAGQDGSAWEPTRAHAPEDGLTGVYSRNHFQGRCAEAIARAEAAGSRLALILLGLDRFKDLNGSFGYQIGDDVLIDIARGLRALLGRNDAIGRFGGDEFALLVTDSPAREDVTSLAGRLLEVTAAIMRRYLPRLRSGASLGIALFPEHGRQVDELIQNADLALHRAKNEARGQAQIYAPHMRAAALGRLEQLAAFQRALEAGEIQPFYQPQMRLTDRRACGFEALARWVRPSGEILAPGQFQAALEDPDTSTLLGEHMLSAVSRDLQHWSKAGLPRCKVSVNAAAPELKRGDYPEKVAGLFAAQGIAPSQLTVEITESVLLDDRGADVAQTLGALRQLGVSIALDDFGTGFASLTHLKSYAVDQIKIDRSFIVHLATSPNDRAIVRATLDLAKRLGMQTVAEGLEDAAQLRCLQMLGCDQGQGFLFSPALPVDEAAAYFKAHHAYRRAQLYQFVLPARP